ncbi:FecCD family ABC transporter permease [Desulfosarcina widdelii]|nr:iron ABC transporter permease [Desulfosarcina widdelii]
MTEKRETTTTVRRGRRLPLAGVVLFMTVLLVAVIVISTGSGFVRIPLPDVARIIAAQLTGLEGLAARLDPLAPVVVMDVRLPRILTAALVGSGLAISGAVFQGILLNPLADPYTLGVSAGAAFGASVALLIDFTLLGPWSVPAFAFCGALATLMAVIYLTASSGDFSSGALILSGIIVAAILSAGVSFIKYLADEQVGIIIFWLMGSFASKTWAEVGLTATAVIPGLIVFLFFSRDLNLLALGSRTAGSLGVATRKISLILLVAASLISAVCVAVSGIIGFVGLLVPHMVRFVTGPDNRRLLPVSALVGAILLLAADTVTRAVLPQEVPIGVITALIGGPVFCYIYRKRQTREVR